jgi:hypothetical protein
LWRGFVVIALVSLIVGPWRPALKLGSSAAPSGPVVTHAAGCPPAAAWQEETPPQLTDRQSGSWQSSGPGAYRLWEEEPVEADRNNW